MVGTGTKTYCSPRFQWPSGSKAFISLRKQTDFPPVALRRQKTTGGKSVCFRRLSIYMIPIVQNVSICPHLLVIFSQFLKPVIRFSGTVIRKEQNWNAGTNANRQNCAQYCTQCCIVCPVLYFDGCTLINMRGLYGKWTQEISSVTTWSKQVFVDWVHSILRLWCQELNDQLFACATCSQFTCPSHALCLWWDKKKFIAPVLWACSTVIKFSENIYFIRVYF